MEKFNMVPVYRGNGLENAEFVMQNLINKVETQVVNIELDKLKKPTSVKQMLAAE